MNPAATAFDQRADSVERGSTDVGAFVAEHLSDLPAGPREAMALVDVFGRSLDEAAEALGAEMAQLPALLAAARGSLRRRRQPISGGGRCLRARRLLSDSMDAQLPPSDSAVLAAHLDNCVRCPRHEQLLREELAKLQEALEAPTVPAPIPLRRVPAAPPTSASAPSSSSAKQPSRQRQAPTAPPAGRTRRRLPARAIAIALSVVAMAAGVVIGGALAIGELDSGAATSRQAPWAEAGAPRIPPRPIE
jgi:Putative zinc-finger